VDQPLLGRCYKETCLGGRGQPLASRYDEHSPFFRCFKTSPEIIRLALKMFVRFPLSLRNVEDFLRERGIEIGHEI
jgi:hypothetical protein